MINQSDKNKLKSGACPEGGLFNTGSGKDDVYLGAMARELEGNKESVSTNETAATDNFMTEAAYVAANGENNYQTIYDDDAHIGDNFCSQPEIINAMRVLGYFIFIAKIFVPLIIIGFSVFDMFHAVTGGDEKSLKDSAKKLGIRVLIGITIFLVPTILNVVLTAIDQYNDILSDAYICQTCLLKPQECESGVPSDTNPFDTDVFNTGNYEGSEDENNDNESNEEDSDEEIVVE